ncbi:hypothetical protein HDU98_003598 [Podochytrium sp. JEL0797]|nr:hypothetical protein HDU98_003598 [Podochytrium sp. JEL0797]
MVRGVPATIQLALAANLVFIHQVYEESLKGNGRLPPLLAGFLADPRISFSGVGVIDDCDKITRYLGAKYVHPIHPAFKGPCPSGHDLADPVLEEKAAIYCANDAIASLLVARGITEPGARSFPGTPMWDIPGGPESKNTQMKDPAPSGHKWDKPVLKEKAVIYCANDVIASLFEGNEGGNDKEEEKKEWVVLESDLLEEGEILKKWVFIGIGSDPIEG